MPAEMFRFLEINGAMKQLEDLKEQLEDMKDPNKLIRQFLRLASAEAKEIILSRFETQTAPDGAQWKDYVKDPSRPRDQLLGGIEGSIATSIKVVILRDGFRVESIGEGASKIMFHQRGTKNMIARKIFPAWSDDSDPDQDADSSQLELLMQASFAKACDEMGITWVGVTGDALEFTTGVMVSKKKESRAVNPDHLPGEVRKFTKEQIAELNKQYLSKGRK